MEGDDEPLVSQGIEALAEGVEEVDTMLTRPGENRLKRWILLDGDRRTVAGVLLFSVFLTLVVLAIVWPIQMQDLLTETSTVQMLFNSLLSGTILLVSIVVSINSVVLSQDLTSLGAQRNRIQHSMEFRSNVEDVIDPDVSPYEPAKFLRAILDAVQTRGNRLHERATDSSDEVFRERITVYVNILNQQVNQVNAKLANAERGSKTVLLAGLAYDYSWQIYAARRLQFEHADALSEERAEAFDDLIGILESFGVAREYFKTLYYMQEFATLSRTLLYVSLPTLVFISYVLLGIDARLFPDIRVFNLTPLMVSVIVAYTIAFTPYVVLTAYLIRPATVAKRTLAAGPFVLTSESEADQAFDW